MKKNSLRAKRRQPKVEAACQRLTLMAHQLGPGHKMPTVVELCQVLNISKGTLDSALRELEEQNIIRRAHGAGIFVSPKFRTPIFLVCPSWLDDDSIPTFWRMLKEFVKEEVEKKNMDFVVAALHSNDIRNEQVAQQITDLIHIGRSQGVLALHLDIGITEWLSSRGIPLVTFPGYAESMVNLDQDYVVTGGVWHLAKRNCTRIGYAYLSSPLWFDASGHNPRVIQNFQVSLQLSNIGFYPEMITVFSDTIVNSASNLEKFGYEYAKTLFQGAVQPDGLIITSDQITRGVIFALDELGIRLWDDVKIVSQANRNSTELAPYEDRLILMEFDTRRIAHEMVGLLEELLHGEVGIGGQRLVRPLARTPDGK